MESKTFKSPVMKLVRFFKRSRDKWKAKHHKVKQELKLMGNQVRAVEKSRAHWKEVAQQERQRVRELSRELEKQKTRMVA
jgi:muramoyltetrapeptide carboxypeptidase LdcA involved in peptidoglycan recycling